MLRLLEQEQLESTLHAMRFFNLASFLSSDLCAYSSRYDPVPEMISNLIPHVVTRPMLGMEGRVVVIVKSLQSIELKKDYIVQVGIQCLHCSQTFTERRSDECSDLSNLLLQTNF